MKVSFLLDIGGFYLYLLLCVCTINVFGLVQQQSCFYSFFLQAFRHKSAAYAVYKRLRLFYRHAPLYILIDRGGEDLREFCSSDANCALVFSEVKYGHDWQNGQNKEFRNSTLTKMNSFFQHMKEAALWGNSTFLVYLEEDVWFQKEIEERDIPQGDVGGIWNPWYKPFNPRLQAYIAQQKNAIKMSNPRVIFAASYFRSAALIDCVDRILPTADWRWMHYLDNRVPMNWDTVPPVLFALGGYNIVPWSAACEVERRYLEYTNRSCSEAPLKHKNNPTTSLYFVPWNRNMIKNRTQS